MQYCSNHYRHCSVPAWFRWVDSITKKSHDCVLYQGKNICNLLTDRILQPNRWGRVILPNPWDRVTAPNPWGRTFLKLGYFVDAIKRVFSFHTPDWRGHLLQEILQILNCTWIVLADRCGAQHDDYLPTSTENECRHSVGWCSLWQIGYVNGKNIKSMVQKSRWLTKVLSWETNVVQCEVESEVNTHMPKTKKEFFYPEKLRKRSHLKTLFGNGESRWLTFIVLEIKELPFP